jgi:hypothetical protein
MEGWIALHRKITNHWVYDDSDFFKVWVTMLMDANHTSKRRMFNGVLTTIERGQLLFGLQAFSSKSGVSISKLRRILAELEAEGMISRQKTNKYSLISISNYDTYQNSNSQESRPAAGKTNSNRSPEGKQTATPEQCKQNQQFNNDGPSTAVGTHRSPLPPDWSPSRETFESLSLRGVPEDFAVDQLLGFRLYWLDDGRPKENWDRAFLQRCKDQWEKHCHKSRGEYVVEYGS